MKYCKSEAVNTLRALPESVTVCATVDESGDEHVITELMIRRACEQMDAHQIWPYAGDMHPGALRTLSTRSATILPFQQRSN